MYKIKYLPNALFDETGIMLYLSETLAAPAAARNLLNDIEKAKKNLQIFPFCYPAYYIQNRKSHYRIIPVKNYLIFYKVLSNTVEIHRIIYSQRNITHVVNSKS